MMEALSLGASSTRAASWDIAAWCDGGAFARMADLHYQRWLNGIEAQVVALERAAEYARLAAAGGSREDWISLLFLLDQHADALRAEGQNDIADLVQAEAVALAEYMANKGDEEVGHMLDASAEHLSPAVLQLARDRPFLPTGPIVPIVPNVLRPACR
jgi:hypothetical protein